MSYTAQTFNVMIASPGDVASERGIARDVIYEWNAVNSGAKKIVLLPVGWETHASPEMGDSAQSIINKQVLAKCDLVVGIFWTRIGTATDKFASGTVEEIETHIATGKPTMLYFSAQPVRLDTVDEDQYKQLREFKSSCQTRGLLQKYDSHADFKEKFYRHLQQKVNEDGFFLVASDETESEILDSSVKLPDLTADARVLLKEASIDPGGDIIYMRTLGGTDLQVNGKNLIASNDRREVARWEGALQSLINLELVVARGTKGQVFEVTDLGYRIADMIEL